MEKNNIINLENNKNIFVENKSRFAILNKEDVNVCAQVIVNNATRVVEAVSLYLEDADTHLPLIDGGRTIEIKKVALSNAMDYKVIAAVQNFDLDFGPDDLKKIFARCQELIKSNENNVDIKKSMTIHELYQELFCLCERVALREEYKGTPKWERKCIVDEDTFSIRCEIMEKVLMGVGGYDKNGFFRALRMLEAHMGIQILASGKGRNAWGTTFCDEYGKKYQLRFYRFYRVNLHQIGMGGEKIG